MGRPHRLPKSLSALLEPAKTIAHLVAHSGGVHADELLSSVILTQLFPDATRTRDKAWITPAADHIINDVGGDFNAEAQIFDHYQRPNPLREDGQPYSSFGLLWAQYGRDCLRAMVVPEQDIEGIWGAFDRGFVLPGDLVDNGAVNSTFDRFDLRSGRVPFIEAVAAMSGVELERVEANTLRQDGGDAFYGMFTVRIF